MLRLKKGGAYVMSKYTGVIIEESLKDAQVLDNLKITNTKIEQVTPSHETPHLKQWTLHSVDLDSEDLDSIANKISHNLLPAWFVHFYDNDNFVVVFPEKVFTFAKSDKVARAEVEQYGISIGIPPHQMDLAEFFV